MKWLHWLLAVFAAAVLGAAVFWFLRHYEWSEKPNELPPRGEARYNPLYGLGKALQAAGYDVVSRATLDLQAMAPAPGDVLLLGTEVRSIGEAQTEALVDWVRQGGQLIFALPASDIERQAPLLARLDLPLDGGEYCLGWTSHGVPAPGELCAQHRIAWQDRDDWIWTWPPDADAAGYLAVRAQLGDGAWLALPHLRFLRGRELKDPNHVALTWALLEPMLGEGRVFLVYATDLPPAHVLLLRHGWPVWIPLLLALLFWLWRRSQRLGPVLPLPAPDRRALLEHVRAAGEFAFRRQRGVLLHAALRRRFEARLAREHPLLAALDGEAQVLAIARAWGLEADAVRHALHPADLRRPEAFLGAIHSLSRLQTPP